jgi:nicotinamidase-related amidase
MSERESPTALLVIDVQRAFDDPSWGTRNNPACEDNIAALIAGWRAKRWPLVYVRHDSREPDSTLHPEQSGNAFKEIVTGEPDLLVVKNVNSAFYGTPDLHEWLQSQQLGRVAICGITTNHCCETTARMAGNLGYETLFVLDATHTFARQDLQGRWLSADELARVTGANLHDEFAEVTDTKDVLARLDGPG